MGSLRIDRSERGTGRPGSGGERSTAPAARRMMRLGRRRPLANCICRNDPARSALDGLQLVPGYRASNRLGRHAEFCSKRRHGVSGMRSDAVQLPLLQMRQQGLSEDG
jgi:hypothetical protein